MVGKERKEKEGECEVKRKYKGEDKQRENGERKGYESVDSGRKDERE